MQKQLHALGWIVAVSEVGTRLKGKKQVQGEGQVRSES
jgi:hypothetical protein